MKDDLWENFANGAYDNEPLHEEPVTQEPEEEVVDEETQQETEEGYSEEEGSDSAESEETQEETQEEIDYDNAVFPIDVDGKEVEIPYKEAIEVLQAYKQGKLGAKQEADLSKYEGFINETKPLIEQFSKSSVMKFAYENLIKGQGDEDLVRAIGQHYLANKERFDGKQAEAEPEEEFEDIYDPQVAARLKAINSQNKKLEAELQQLKQQKEQESKQAYAERVSYTNTSMLENGVSKLGFQLTDLSDSEKQSIAEALADYAQGQNITYFPFTEKQMTNAIKLAIGNKQRVEAAPAKKINAAQNLLRQKSAPQIVPGTVKGKQSPRGAVQEIKGTTKISQKTDNWMNFLNEI